MANKREQYSAVVTANALQTSRSGTSSVAIQVQTIANLVTGKEEEKTFIGNLFLTPRTAENTVKTLREIFDYKTPSFLPLNNTELLVGKECEITVDYEDYEGELRAKIQWFNKPGNFASRRIKPIAEDLARSVAAQYDGYFSATAPNAAASYGSARQAPPTAFDGPDNTSDLPF